MKTKRIKRKNMYTELRAAIAAVQKINRGGKLRPVCLAEIVGEALEAEGTEP